TRSRANAAMQLAYELWITTHNKQYAQQLFGIAETSKAQVLADERIAHMDRTGGAVLTDTLHKKERQLQGAIIYYQHELMQGADTKSITGLLQSTQYELAMLNKKIKQQTPAGLLTENNLTIQQLNALCTAIPKHARVLEFFEGTDSSFLIELDAGGIQSIHLIANSHQLRNNIQHFLQQWFTGGPAAMINAPQQYY